MIGFKHLGSIQQHIHSKNSILMIIDNADETLQIDSSILWGLFDTLYPFPSIKFLITSKVSIAFLVGLNEDEEICFKLEPLN